MKISGKEIEDIKSYMNQNDSYVAVASTFDMYAELIILGIPKEKTRVLLCVPHEMDNMINVMDKAEYESLKQIEDKILNSVKGGDTIGQDSDS